MSAHLMLESVRKSYGAATVLDGITLAAPAGAYVVLLGPSGSGKTTLLSILGGFVPPSGGRVIIGGSDVTALGPASRPTATVFQDYALFPHMSVAGNIGFGLGHLSAAARREAVARMLALVGLADYGGRTIQALSGGQRQRVALARALAVEPSVLLLDEPLGALDMNLRRQMQDELLALHRRTGRCFVHVTHDQDEAMALATILVVMNAGRIEDAGPPDRVYARPATRFTAGFMGESTQIAGRVVGPGVLETVLGRLPVAPGTTGEAVAIIRPENIVVGHGEIALGEAVLREVVFQGAHRRALASGGGIDFVLHLHPELAAAPGDALSLSCRARDIVVVPA